MTDVGYTKEGKTEIAIPPLRDVRGACAGTITRVTGVALFVHEDDEAWGIFVGEIYIYWDPRQPDKSIQPAG